LQRQDQVCAILEEHSMAMYDRTFAAGDAGRDLRARPIRLHWWAVFGGAAIGWGLLFFLSLLGLTIGLAAIDPYSPRPAAGGDLASAIWALAALVLSAFVGAYLIVRLAGERRRREAGVHGAVSWGLSMIAGALLGMAAGNTAARAAAENSPRTSARTDANGSVRMTQRDRDRLEEAKRAAAKTSGAAAAGAFLSLLGALAGAGLGAAHATGRGRGPRALGAPELGRTSLADEELTARQGARAGSDEPTIIPPTH
jgi:hypothetical protein